MKILLLSFHFPPDAPLAATRAPKLARYLLNAGHDVRVLCASDPPDHAAHRLALDPGRVTRTKWTDVRAIPAEWSAKVGFGSRSGGTGNTANGGSGAEAGPPSLRNRLANAYDAAFCRPDRRIGWRKHAIGAARSLFETWKPDVIYATCPPHSTAVIADRIAQIGNIPFIVEFRDRWAHNAYSDHPPWRQQKDIRDEMAVLSRAAAIVTVSPLWAETYANHYGEDRVVLSMNGFDPGEYPLEPPFAPNDDPGTLHLLHAGALYPNRRDPRVLFAGIAALGPSAEHIYVWMMGKDVEPARAMAEEAGIASRVTLLAPESHREVIERQYSADALLLLQWNDPRDAGTIPGKLFECIGARRPVVCTGYTKGVTAEIVRDRGLGVVSNEPKVIASELARLLTRKRALGTIPSLRKSVRDGMSCTEQFAALDPLLHSVTGMVPQLAAAE